MRVFHVHPTVVVIGHQRGLKRRVELRS